MNSQGDPTCSLEAPTEEAEHKARPPFTVPIMLGDILPNGAELCIGWPEF
jgi:hypothetical protein